MALQRSTDQVAEGESEKQKRGREERINKVKFEYDGRSVSVNHMVARGW